MESTSKPNTPSIRGPYRKRKASEEEVQSLHHSMKVCRQIIKQHPQSTYRSKILDSFQDLLDCLSKQMSRDKPTNQVSSLEERISVLEARIAQLEEDKISNEALMVISHFSANSQLSTDLDSLLN